MNERLEKKTEESINKILDEGLTTNNLENLYKLVDIYKDAKEVDNMNYGNYGGRPMYDNYGRDSYRGYNDYGRRGYDTKYKGDDHLNRVYEDYGRYEEEKQRYGANENTKRSLQYMLKSMEDFARMLKEDARSQEEVQMIRDTAQRIAQM